MKETIRKIWKFLTPYAIQFWELFGIKIEPSKIEQEVATGCFIFLLICVCGISIMIFESIWLNRRGKRMVESAKKEMERGCKIIE